MKEEKNHPVILIVDDDSENLKVLGNLLRPHEYQLAFATNGEEAVETARESQPDLILLDVMMPGMDGYEVACQLQENENTSNIPVIFLTAKTSPEDVVSGFITGGVDYITKPFYPPELVARVQTHLQLRQAKRELWQLNNELMHVNNHLNELNKNQKRFFLILAHDLKTQVGASLSLQNLLKETMGKMSQEELTENIGAIQQHLNRNFVFLENLLEWGRIQMEQVAFCPREFSAYECVGGIMEISRPDADHKEVTLENRVSKDLRLYGDWDMVSTLVRNLLNNALKFTAAGGRITVLARQTDDGAEVTVADTGVGIPPKVKDKLFKLDEKVTRPGTAKEIGSGFGLKLCRAMAEKHGGKIWVESEEGQGSRFYFTLPAKPSP